MADDLLFVYSSPGIVDLAEFTDWYDNEHVPARLAVPAGASGLPGVLSCHDRLQRFVELARV